MSRFVWLLLCLPGAIHAQYDFDSTYQVLASRPLDSTTLIDYAMLINGQLWEDLARARSLQREVEAKFRGVEASPDAWGRFEVISGMVYHSSGSLDTALQHILRAKDFSERGHDERQRAIILSALGDLYANMGDLEAATEYSLQYLQLAEQGGNPYDIARANVLMGDILKKRKRTAPALRYFKDSYDLMERAVQSAEEGSNDWYTALDLMNNAATELASLEEIRGNPDAARQWMDRAVEIARSLDQPLNIAQTLRSRGYLHYKLNRYEEALADFEAARTSYAQLKGSNMEKDVYYLMSTIYLDREQPRRALPLLHQYFAAVEQEVGSEAAPDAYRQMIRVQRQLDRTDSVAHYQSSLIETLDSTYQVEVAARVEEVQTRYETEKREATIAEQQTEISRRELRERWILGGLLAAALLGGIIFYLYRRQQRVSAELARKNQQNEFLVREIHHRTKNNLQVLSSLLALQSDYITDPAALDAVTEGRNRVQSIGLLHQQLYTDTEIESVDPEKYFRDLGDHLLDTFGREDEVTIDYRISAPPVNVEHAIPLGLIANELLTNSLKYAYPPGTEGTIEFTLIVNGKDLLLRVADEGAGTTTTTPSGTGFGRDLVDILREKLNATVTENRSAAGYATEVRGKL